MRQSKILQVMSVAVLFFYAWTFMGVCDFAYAIEKRVKESGVKSRESKGKSTAEKFERAWGELEQSLANPAADYEAKRKHAQSKRGEIDKLDKEIRAEFARTEKKLQTANLPPEILARHYKFVKHYEDNLNELKANLTALDKAKDKPEADAAGERLKAHLAKVKPLTKHIPLDPNKLPHRAAEPVYRAPRINKEDFEKGLGKQRAALPIIEESSELRVASLELNTLKDVGEPLVSGFEPSTLNPQLSTPLYAAANPPSPEDLSETIEIQFTPEIRAKAQELGNNPVKIYEWVRNNVEFVPTYGSIQGAQMTLLTKQGNAFDTASLLIALLRVSNIPARYVYGTIELPIEKVMNWVGGFTDAKAALDLIASGGIPVVAYASGGKIAKVRIEHVWVEGWIDYIPSRGAVHREGDTWIPLDGSFKQYSYTSGIDITQVVPFDADGFINRLSSTAQLNQNLSSITFIDTHYIQTTFTDYREQVKNWLDNNMPNATMGNILGTKTIISQNFPYLLGTLPYRVVVVANKFSTINAALRVSITITMYADYLAKVLGEPSLQYSLNLPSLNNGAKRLGITYEPATQTDVAVLQSYIQNQAKVLPLYLFQVKPILKLDGAVLAVGPPVGMGQSQEYEISINEPQNLEKFNCIVNAGDEVIFSVDGNGVTPELVQKRLEEHKLMENNYPYPTAESLHQAGLHYWMEVDLFAGLTAKANQVHFLRRPSAGTVSCPLSVAYFMGLPFSGNYLSRQMDMKVVRQCVSANSPQFRYNYMYQIGLQGSFFEGFVFDQLFLKGPMPGISAVRLLEGANRLGIPVNFVTKDNFADLLPVLVLDDAVIADINSAVNAGKIVIVPAREMAWGTWKGVGYVIQDPQTGNGAYRINGGLSGGCQENCVASLMPYSPSVLTEVSAIVAPLAKMGTKYSVDIVLDTTVPGYIMVKFMWPILAGLMNPVIMVDIIVGSAMAIGVIAGLAIGLLMAAYFSQQMANDALRDKTYSDSTSCSLSATDCGWYINHVDPNIWICSALETNYKYVFANLEEAEGYLEFTYGPIRVDPPIGATGGPCPVPMGGEHRNVFIVSTGENVESIVSCPCCQDVPGGFEIQKRFGVKKGGEY